MYARQLAEHYQSQGGQQGQAGYGERRSQPYARSNNQNNQNNQNKDEREYSFFDGKYTAPAVMIAEINIRR